MQKFKATQPADPNYRQYCKDYIKWLKATEEAYAHSKKYYSKTNKTKGFNQIIFTLPL